MGWAQLFVAVVMAYKQAEVQSDIVNQQVAVETSSLETKAAQREADRKKQLAEAMSSARAHGGAGSASMFEGSPLAILEEDLRQAEIDTERDRFNTDVSALTAKYKASAAKSQARMKAKGSIIGAFGNAGENGLFS